MSIWKHGLRNHLPHNSLRGRHPSEGEGAAIELKPEEITVVQTEHGYNSEHPVRSVELAVASTDERLYVSTTIPDLSELIEDLIAARDWSQNLKEAS